MQFGTECTSLIMFGFELAHKKSLKLSAIIKRQQVKVQLLLFRPSVPALPATIWTNKTNVYYTVLNKKFMHGPKIKLI